VAPGSIHVRIVKDFFLYGLHSRSLYTPALQALDLRLHCRELVSTRVELALLRLTLVRPCSPFIRPRSPFVVEQRRR
jgi:hypothetical protein